MVQRRSIQPGLGPDRESRAVRRWPPPPAAPPGTRRARAGRILALNLALNLALFLFLALALAGGSARGGGARGQGVGAGAPVLLDQASEVALAQPLRLPLLGPRYALVTLDLFVAVGQKGSDINLGLALRRAAEAADVRLLLHPVTNSALAERGAEVIWEALEQQPAGCYPFIKQLYSHPEWLALTTEGQEALLGAAGAAGLDPQRLRRSLLGHRHRAAVSALWQAVREQVRYPPELWVNGRHLRGTLTDAQLREELDRQRTRAQRALHSGTPPTQLYEKLVAEEAGERADDSAAPARPWGRIPTPSPAPPASPPPSRPGVGSLASHLELTGMPSRGPHIATVTLVLVGSLDSYGTYGAARAAYEVWKRHPDSVRLVLVQAPRSETSQRIARLLAQVAIVDEARFWRLFDSIIELLPRRFFLRYADVESLVRREGGYSLIEAGLRTPAAEARVRHDLEQTRRLGIENSPVVLVNGLPVRGAPLAEALELAIERERQRGLLQRLHAPAQRIDYGWLAR